MCGTGSYLPILADCGCSVVNGVPNGNINLLTDNLERLIIAFSGEIRLAA